MLYLVTKNWATAQRNHCIGSLVQGYLSVTCWDISSSKRLVLIWESHLGKPSLLNSNGIFMTILQFFKGEPNLVRPLLESRHLTGLLSKAVWQWCISKKKKKSAFAINVHTRMFIKSLMRLKYQKRGRLLWSGETEWKKQWSWKSNFMVSALKPRTGSSSL